MTRGADIGETAPGKLTVAIGRGWMCFKNRGGENRKPQPRGGKKGAMQKSRQTKGKKIFAGDAACVPKVVRRVGKSDSY